MLTPRLCVRARYVMLWYGMLCHVLPWYVMLCYALGTAMHREESVDANDANFLLKAPASPQCQQRSC